jgi:hypothetical protein
LNSYRIGVARKQWAGGKQAGKQAGRLASTNFVLTSVLIMMPGPLVDVAWPACAEHSRLLLGDAVTHWSRLSDFHITSHQLQRHQA